MGHSGDDVRCFFAAREQETVVYASPYEIAIFSCGILQECKTDSTNSQLICSRERQQSRISDLSRSRDQATPGLSSVGAIDDTITLATIIEFRSAMDEVMKQGSPQGSSSDQTEFQPGLSERRLQARYLLASEDRVSANSELHDLCETCDRTLRSLTSPSYKKTLEEKISGGFVLYHSSVDAMIASLMSGCALCRLLLDHEDFDSRFDDESPLSQDSPLYLGCYPLEDDPDPDFLYSRLRYLRLASSAQMKRVRKTGRWADPECYFKVSFVPDCETVKSCDRNVPRVAPLALATSWLEHCRHYHPDCRPDGGIKPPTRLIDVSIEGRPRLVSLREQVIYAALSHCWGAMEHRSCLTSKNIDSYFDEIPFGNLEPNFQDAVVAARGVGYRYLWIDVLCIIQDDDVDWQKECTRMDDVYASADLVLAATWAPDSNAGFLARNNPRGQVCDIPLFLLDGQCLGSLHVRVSPPELSAENQSPLGYRAWAFQEKQLAHRFLSFGCYQMSYQCLCSTQLETGRHPYEYDLAADHPPVYIPGLVWPKNPELPRVPSFEFYRIVQRYTKLRLSREDDRLPALSGIAKRFQDHTGDQYLAGLWRNDLVVGLAWQVTSFLFTGIHWSATQSSPSWSWATNNVPIEYDMNFQALDVAHQQKFREGDARIWTEVVDAHVELAGLDPFGKVTGGRLTLLSRICRLSIGPCRNPHGVGYYVLTYDKLRYWPDDPSDPELLDDGFDILTFPLWSAHDGWGYFIVNMLVIKTSKKKPLQYRRSGVIYGCLASNDLIQANELITKLEGIEPEFIHIV